jgi:hemoglobin
MKQSVFERAGGFSSVRKIVSAFYDRVLDEPIVGRHFADLDMARLVDHQAKFIAQVMGGPAAYTDEQLQRTHARLGITQAEFAVMADLLHETLEDFAMPAEDIEAVDRSFRQREAFIVARRA